MKYLFLLLLASCATYSPPNIDPCVKDSPTSEHCAYIIQGNDFVIDATHPYTNYGENLSFAQFDQEAIRLSVGAYSVLRKGFLDWCHASPKSCTYNDMVLQLINMEDRLKITDRLEAFDLRHKDEPR